MQTLLYGKEARDKVKAGIDKAVNMIKVTLGFKGRNVLVKRSYNSPGYGLQYLPATYTKDGVSVARVIEMQDACENAGCDLVKSACEKTMQLAGDSTTTTAVLLQAIVENGLQFVDEGSNPMEIKKGIDSAVESVIDSMKRLATPVEGDIERIKQIATISANNDVSIGELIGSAFEKIGNDGIIDLEESKTSVTEIKMSDGIKFNRGWISPYFITNVAKSECELIDPYILLYDKKISILKQAESLLGQIMNANASLLVICPEADGEFLAALAMNAAQKRINCCIVKCPEFAEKQREAMEDLSLILGGEYISTEKGTSLEKISMNQLGRADKVIIGQNQTTIISGKGNKDKIQEVISKLKNDLKDADPTEKENIEKRIAKLTGSVAILYVGAATEVEMKEKKDRCDDAIRAVRAAISEGFVAGGGTAFIKASSVSNDNIDLYSDFKKGEFALNKSLMSPLYQLCVNAGINPDEILSDVIKSENSEWGYNGKTDKIENLVDAGIIDPVMALRVALQNAASAAGAVITSEGLIV